MSFKSIQLGIASLVKQKQNFEAKKKIKKKNKLQRLESFL